MPLLLSTESSNAPNKRKWRFFIECPICGKIRKIGYAQVWNIEKGLNSKKCLKCANQKTTSSSFKKGQKPWNLGKGNKNRKLEYLRRTKKFRDWRNTIFERDNYTCQECKQRGGRLNADHIKPFAYYPKVRFSINNGRTLCELCHKKTETYGYKAVKSILK